MGSRSKSQDIEDDQYRARSRVRSNPTQRELRASLLMNPVADAHILDELHNINQTIGSITQASEQQSEDFSTPKLIARSLSRSSLLRVNTERRLSIMSDNEDDADAELMDSPSKPIQRTKRSFVEMLSSPFGSSDSALASPMTQRSIVVPGVGVYGAKPLSLASIHEDTTYTDPINGTAETILNEPRSIKEAIATAVRAVEGSSSPYNKSRNEQQSAVRLEEPAPLNFSPIKERVLRRSSDLGKITGIPQIKSYGIKPIRTSVNDAVDSGQHLLYLRVSTEADSEQSRPYSLIKIGLDRMAERDRIKQERQKPQYKEQKALKLMERPNKTHQEAAITRVSDRFWKDWRLRMRNRYPKGIDIAKGCTSTKLEPIDIPPPPLNSGEIDYYSKYDRSDPQNPWNRYLEFKKDDRLSYQRHLGFHQRKFAPGQILSARKKENFLQRISEQSQADTSTATVVAEPDANKKHKRPKEV